MLYTKSGMWCTKPHSFMITVTNRKQESKEGLANQEVENVIVVSLHLPT